MNKLLVANRGEIARRVFRTAKRLGISTVAVFSDPDEHAPHVAEADEAVRLPGSTSTETYLDIERVVGAALATGADAVHPGYGFLSENANFARACGAAAITFVGPSPEAIEALGSKVAAKRVMAAAGVPVLEGGLVDDGYEVPDGLFPVLVKAVFGGGGRGMRVVHDRAELTDAIASASREAAAAFGDGTVFVERYVANPRHVEVQIFGDTHGNVVHLFERECSIQRRHQKIIEEAPSPAVGPGLREALCAAAVAAGRALDYVGAGTVEFVLDAADDFWFLEVNSRLQVEHPVTELVTGLDLVELQLRIARGEVLALEPQLRGHAVEARLYAEDVGAGYVPVAGLIERFETPTLPGVRVDRGYESGSTVSTFYDAMLAKVIARGDDRQEAVARLTRALGVTRVHGVITNRDLLVGVLRHPDFLAGETDTGFLERHDPAILAARPFDPLHAVAAALTGQAGRRASAPVQPHVPSGWRNVGREAQTVTYCVGEQTIDVVYRLAREGIDVAVNGEPLEDLRVWRVDPDAVELAAGGVRRAFAVHRTRGVVYVDEARASSVLVEQERLPVPTRSVVAGSLAAPLPGTVVQVLVTPGDEVEDGQVLVVLEAMKMEHTVRSPQTGAIAAVLVTVGDQVDGGQVLVVLEETRDG